MGGGAAPLDLPASGPAAVPGPGYSLRKAAGSRGAVATRSAAAAAAAEPQEQHASSGGGRGARNGATAGSSGRSERTNGSTLKQSVREQNRRVVAADRVAQVSGLRGGCFFVYHADAGACARRRAAARFRQRQKVCRGGPVLLACML